MRIIVSRELLFIQIANSDYHLEKREIKQHQYLESISLSVLHVHTINFLKKKKNFP